MARTPDLIKEFLQGRRLAVAGVSRHAGQPANAIFRKLRDTGYDVFPVNPNATELEGAPCYPSVAAVPAPLDGVIMAAHPDVGAELVRECGTAGIGRIWFHRSFGQGSASAEAVRACHARGIRCIVGGCPLMYCEPVDVAHRCFRWWLERRGRIARET
jgi:predicted CoA-binding protein